MDAIENTDCCITKGICLFKPFCGFAKVFFYTITLQIVLNHIPHSLFVVLFGGNHVQVKGFLVINIHTVSSTIIDLSGPGCCLGMSSFGGLFKKVKCLVNVLFDTKSKHIIDAHLENGIEMSFLGRFLKI